MVDHWWKLTHYAHDYLPLVTVTPDAAPLFGLHLDLAVASPLVPCARWPGLPVYAIIRRQAGTEVTHSGYFLIETPLNTRTTELNLSVLFGPFQKEEAMSLFSYSTSKLESYTLLKCFIYPVRIVNHCVTDTFYTICPYHALHGAKVILAGLNQPEPVYVMFPGTGR